MSRRVGILGGGQLGLMLAQSLQKLDVDVRLFDRHVATSPDEDVVGGAEDGLQNRRSCRHVDQLGPFVDVQHVT